MIMSLVGGTAVAALTAAEGVALGADIAIAVGAACTSIYGVLRNR